MARKVHGESPGVASSPPEPAFSRCPCGALVIARVWVHGRVDAAPHWRELGEPQTPGLGKPHVCTPSE
mgnify:CR=1 FL=1